MTLWHTRTRYNNIWSTYISYSTNCNSTSSTSKLANADSCRTNSNCSDISSGDTRSYHTWNESRNSKNGPPHATRKSCKASLELSIMWHHIYIIHQPFWHHSRHLQGK